MTQRFIPDFSGASVLADGRWRRFLRPAPLPGETSRLSAETPWVRWPLALLLALGTGPVLASAFPALGWWPLTFVGVIMIVLAVIGRGFWMATGLGILAGVGFYLTLVSWTALYLGPVPWLALSVLEGIIFGLGAGCIAVVARRIPRIFSPRVAWAVTPMAIATVWITREEIAGNWPYGGFAWGRLILAHAESPFGTLVSWVGFTGASFVLALLPVVFLYFWRSGIAHRPARALLPALIVAALLAVPLAQTEQIGTSRIAAVQGNGPAGYFDKREPGDVLQSQLKASLPLLDKRPDMVVWPENGSDLNPMLDPRASQALNSLGQLLDAPIITGTITQRDGNYYNTSLMWEAGQGPLDGYDKVRPIPFGEYVPDRSFWEPLAPDLIGLIGRDYTPGTRDNVFDVRGTIAAISICFDIVDDNLLREGVERGAQVILAQTNNADFGKTAENEQQLAIARLRALETGRALVNISTVGTSQTVDANGNTLAEIAPYQPGYMIADVPLYRGITPGVTWGQTLQIILGWSGAMMIAGALIFGTRRRTRPSATRVPPLD
ncbi:apolipoprotein N-acyltransferase [Mycetocola sp. BIGb0189]|uniref:apolipoprotein N-acyltransferase n=1 Tax=Mycetocola sp. BIGb0189 TaxID=2940604 RepID=UPI002168742D|nr:apolipoprotein N-acyltransferase [Mycetocola sp. BIGb0189]MCS4277068.1 apolipoprotein N-acyltransferase [Mycetocola sp. BIGb0189]